MRLPGFLPGFAAAGESLGAADGAAGAEGGDGKLPLLLQGTSRGLSGLVQGYFCLQRKGWWIPAVPEFQLTGLGVSVVGLVTVPAPGMGY